MEMQVYLVSVEGVVSPRVEIAAAAWVGANGECPGQLAPANPEPRTAAALR